MASFSEELKAFPELELCGEANADAAKIKGDKVFLRHTLTICGLIDQYNGLRAAYLQLQQANQEWIQRGLRAEEHAVAVAREFKEREQIRATQPGEPMDAHEPMKPELPELKRLAAERGVEEEYCKLLAENSKLHQEVAELRKHYAERSAQCMYGVSPDPRLPGERQASQTGPFPELKFSTDPSTVKAVWPDGSEKTYDLSGVVDLYRGVLHQYLALQGARKLRPVVDAAAEQAFDLRLPGERQVPTEPGLYLARYQNDIGWWAIIEVNGESPYLQMSHWNEVQLGVQHAPIFWSKLYFGARLAGPDWRKVEPEVKA